MCGIAGIYNFNNEAVPVESLKRMIDIMRHRGPDDEGFMQFGSKSEATSPVVVTSMNSPFTFHLSPYNIGFGHCRLAIIDLSEAGHQPMCNEDGTIWITYNGEIYNYLELGQDLKSKGHIFKSKTDTEVIIHAYEEWGINCIQKFNGMWAFAVWDAPKKRLFCARDRMGIKPFYYYIDKERFLFASEIKALLVNPFIDRRPNDKIIWDYLVNEYVDHTENTFFSDIKQLLPAHYLLIENKDLSIYRYWDLEPNTTLSDITDAETARQFYELFEDAVCLHLQSEVPLGTCLSGGLDSSSIVCMVNKLLFSNGLANKELIGEQQKTFSSCFEDKRFDERDFIQEVVRQTKVQARYVFPDGTDLLDSMDTMIWHQDEPFPSVRLLSQWCVMELARENGITVLLDGQGGDELLAGYHFFFQPYFEYLLKTTQLKRLVEEIKFHSKLHNQPKLPIIKDLLRFIIPGRFLELRKYILNKIGNNENPNSWINKDFSRQCENKTIGPSPLNDPFKACIYKYLTKYRLPSLLRYEDRNSMAFSLEARVPFLDYRLVEFIFSLPNTQIIRNGMTKYVLRNAMKTLIPEIIRNRTDKMGFVVPESYWLQKLNKEQILDIFTSRSFSQRGYFNHSELLRSYELYCSGQPNVNCSLVWRWMNLELWFRKFIDKRGFNENFAD
ncbi:MAG: asparagine synthase (glutamine-hydrolyzing) [Nitrospirae bacterium RBG_13_41_22]|nr:MAG: asparagine synthase (glutamine-hydrolyzing) [Nitrospirae bacterium RBG_13_41_22]